MPFYVRTVRITALPEEAERATERHRGHLAELRRTGKLRIAGEFREGDGFLEIFEARDLLEAEEIGRASPLVEEGMASWSVREWREID